MSYGQVPAHNCYFHLTHIQRWQWTKLILDQYRQDLNQNNPFLVYNLDPAQVSDIDMGDEYEWIWPFHFQNFLKTFNLTTYSWAAFGSHCTCYCHYRPLCLQITFGWWQTASWQSCWWSHILCFLTTFGLNLQLIIKAWAGFDVLEHKKTLPRGFLVPD